MFMKPMAKLVVKGIGKLEQVGGDAPRLLKSEVYRVWKNDPQPDLAAIKFGVVNGT